MKPPWDMDIAVRTVLLERFRLTWSRRIPEHTLANARTEWVIDRVTEGAIYTIELELYGEHLDRTKVRYPKDWFEHAKEALYTWLGKGWDDGHWPWFGAYCRKHWPVQYMEVEVDVRALYPSLPGTEHFLHVVKTEEV